MDYEFCTFDKLQELTNVELPVMFDTETIGLYGKIRIAQFYQHKWNKVLVIEYPDPMKLVSYLSNVHFVIHNAHYDITTIQEQLGRLSWVPDNFDCTFLLSRLHFYKEDGFSLDKVIEYITGDNPYSNVNDHQGSNWSALVLSEDQLQYAIKDVVYLQLVYDTVKHMKDDINYKLDIISTKYALEYQNNGLPIDMDIVTEMYKENAKRIKEIALPINCNSYQQVRKYINSNLSDDLGLATLISKGCEKALAVRETRGLSKENSFLSKFANTERENRIYGKFKFSPRSGRSSSDDQNLQQLPRSLKKVFGFKEDHGKVLLYADYPQIQLRGACVVASDTTMADLFYAGEDVHNYVTKFIFGDDFTPEQRQICKTANFGLLFGAGVTVFNAILLKEAGLVLSETEALNLKRKWLKLWVDIARWQTNGIKDWKKKIPWETPLGRRYLGKMMTDQLAMQIQGFEAEVAKLAIHYFTPKLKELHSSIKLCNFVHDSYIIECDDDITIYEPAAIIIAEAMQEAWVEMSKAVSITDLPMPTKVRVGYNWGDIEKGKFIFEVNR